VSTATTERKDAAVKLSIDIEVPSSVDQGDVLGRLNRAAYFRQGVTITMPEGDKVDVDLVLVQEVH
jgi:hypothetical protein